MIRASSDGLLTSHFRVVGALVDREIATRFGGKPGGYLWALLEPVAQITLMSLIFSAITRTPALGSSFLMFFATGFIPFQFYQAIASYVSKAIKSNRSLLAYPVVSPIDTVVARTILQLFTTTIVAIMVLLTIRYYFVRFPEPIDWVKIIESVFAATVLGLSIALVNISMALRYPVYDDVFRVVSRPLFLISGVFFLPDVIPHPYREWVLLNPLVHVVMLFRQGFYPSYRAYGLDTEYVATFLCIAFFAGLFLFTMSRRKMRSAE